MLPPLGTESQKVIPFVLHETRFWPRDKSHARKLRQAVASVKRFDLWATRLFAFGWGHERPIQDAFITSQRHKPAKDQDQPTA